MSDITVPKVKKPRKPRSKKVVRVPLGPEAELTLLKGIVGKLEQFLDPDYKVGLKVNKTDKGPSIGMTNYEVFNEMVSLLKDYQEKR